LNSQVCQSWLTFPCCDEVIKAIENKTIQDAFGCGTAATVAQIKIVGYNDQRYELPDFETRDFTNKLISYLDSYRRGKLDDKFGWRVKIG